MDLLDGSFRKLILLTSLTMSAMLAADSPKLPPQASGSVDFSRDIEPLLMSRCGSCHGSQQQMGGLRLDSHENTTRGGYSGAAIQPGHSADSILVQLGL
jgi:hypothetical protein